jgi:hypothetical protein
MTNPSKLVIVPCGRSKIWNKHPDAGSCVARDAYVGSPFKVNRKYAECVGDQWVILSAKYGFIAPNFVLPGPYEVTFKRKASGPVSHDVLRLQVSELRLDQYSDVIGLGGKEYRTAISAAFEGTGIDIHFPFAGLPIGKAMRAASQFVEEIASRHA